MATSFSEKLNQKQVEIEKLQEIIIAQDLALEVLTQELLEQINAERPRNKTKNHFTARRAKAH